VGAIDDLEAARAALFGASCFFDDEEEYAFALGVHPVDVYCGKTLILVRSASRSWESTGLWVDTAFLLQRLPAPVSKSTQDFPKSGSLLVVPVSINPFA
jgi:hypothetical protein